jgi:hypothetical protein
MCVGTCEGANPWQQRPLPLLFHCQGKKKEKWSPSTAQLGCKQRMEELPGACPLPRPAATSTALHRLIPISTDELGHVRQTLGPSGGSDKERNKLS